MKSKFIYSLVLAASLVACTDDYKDWASPLSNPQDEIVAFGNGSVKSVDVIDMANIEEGVDSVQVCTISSPTASDAAYRPSYTITLGDKSYGISENGKMAVADLKDYVVSTFGKRPVEREFTATISSWLNNGETAVKLAAADFTIKAVLVAPKISANYYVVGGSLDWGESAKSKAQKFSHSDKDVYDDPVFTITIPAAGEGDTWFAIGDDEALEAISNDNVWNKLLGTASGNGNNGESGQLKARSELSDDGSFKVDAGAKFIKIELNMMDGTYKVTPLNFNQYIGVIGNHNGWGADEPIASPSYDGIYQGYVYLNGDFKIRQNASWDDADTWGGNGTDGALVQPGANLNVSEAGVYQVDANLQTSTYSLTKVNSITCVGNHNGWNVSDASQHMTYNVENKCWEITTTLTNGFKFAMNDDWTVSWGGADGNPANYDNLTQNNGKDLDAPQGDGEYLVQLYLTCEGKSKVVLTKK